MPCSSVVTLLLGICLLSISLCWAQVQRVTVSTPSGQISGRVTPVPGGNVSQFLGIPYASPPLGELRFARPVPVRPWAGTLDALSFRPACPQPGRPVGNSEDCLYLNIFVNNNDSARGPRAVMVWIHGGGFVVGSGRNHDGSMLALRGDVVVVTINYRLGMLGWLSTLDQASPGNNGLWDQRTALLWVRNNIAAFGGNPNMITIFGESGGGYTVGLLSVSPLSQGLFQRAIMQSGSALNRRTIALDPVGFAQRFADSLNCLVNTSTGFNSSFLVQCARGRTVRQILDATSDAARRDYLAWILNVAPVVDGEIIPTDVRTLLGPLYRNRIPFWSIDIMVGTTNAEGSLVMSPLLPFQGELNFSLRQGIPTRVLCNSITDALARDYFQGSQPVSNALCSMYRTRGDDAEQARRVVDLYGDMMFVAPAVETLQLHANVSGRRQSRYQYLFSHGQGSGYQWFRGAGHGAEVNFVFGMFMRDRNESLLALAMMDGWANFAKFGNPNNPDNQNPNAFQWPAYDLQSRAYTDLDLTITQQRDLYSQRMRFWLQTIPNLGGDITRVSQVSSTESPGFGPLEGSNTTSSSNSSSAANAGMHLGPAVVRVQCFLLQYGMPLSFALWLFV